MLMSLDPQQLTGLDDSHLVSVTGNHRLQADVAEAFTCLQRDAAQAGFELTIASSFRSFSRQLLIWNGKASGERAVHDDGGVPVDMAALPAMEQVHAILRYSALPGASRHHWGTDMDIFDAAALPEGQNVQLVPGEVAPGGIFDPLHNWLDERMAADESQGFFRPYGVDRGGVAPERWHLSYAPLALNCGNRFSVDLLRERWVRELQPGGMLLRREVEDALQGILQRYVSVPEGWCPGEYL